MAVFDINLLNEYDAEQFISVDLTKDNTCSTCKNKITVKKQFHIMIDENDVIICEDCFELVSK